MAAKRPPTTEVFHKIGVKLGLVLRPRHAYGEKIVMVWEGVAMAAFSLSGAPHCRGILHEEPEIARDVALRFSRFVIGSPWQHFRSRADCL